MAKDWTTYLLLFVFPSEECLPRLLMTSLPENNHNHQFTFLCLFKTLKKLFHANLNFNITFQQRVRILHSQVKDPMLNLHCWFKTSRKKIICDKNFEAGFLIRDFLQFCIRIKKSKLFVESWMWDWFDPVAGVLKNFQEFSFLQKWNIQLSSNKDSTYWLWLNINWLLNESP